MAEQIQQAQSILRRRQVEVRTGLSRSTIYERVRAGTFPAPLQLGIGKAVGWLESDVDRWISDLVAKSRKGAE